MRVLIAGVLAVGLTWPSLTAAAQQATPATPAAAGDPRGLFGDPRHADLAGYWLPKFAGQTAWADESGDWPLTDAYGKILDDARALVDAGTPPSDNVSECLALGAPRFMTRDFWAIQTPGLYTLFTPVLHEARFIYTDGRGHMPTDEKTFGGDSVGRWEGATLVVETINLRAGVNDIYGMPHSDQLVVTERFSRPTPDTLRVEITLKDPLAYTMPWTKVFEYRLGAHTERPYEYICTENNRNRSENGVQGLQ